MNPHPFPLRSTPAGWPFPCRMAGSTSERPLLVRRDSQTTVPSSLLWCRPAHWLDGGAVRGADLVTRSDYQALGCGPGEQASWLLREASRQASLCERSMTLCLAVPPELPCDANLVGLVEAALQGWAPKQCALELLLDDADLVEADAAMLLAMSALRDIGVGLAMECGRDLPGSLAHMRRLPLTCLRLPAGLVGSLPQSRPARLAVAQIVQEALASDAGIMAQGVQTDAQRDVLTDLGCDSAQGTLFGHPMPAVAFQAALLSPHYRRACA